MNASLADNAAAWFTFYSWNVPVIVADGTGGTGTSTLALNYGNVAGEQFLTVDDSSTIASGDVIYGKAQEAGVVYTTGTLCGMWFNGFAGLNAAK